MHRLKNLKELKLVRRIFQRHFSSKNDQNHIRNIGILAHIDAGKTTTTERMLFYAGKTQILGEVHHGTTVTDYLKQERDRGITICSSAVTFDWKDHRINLLDTPGHIDFTMEVEQSLSAVDGTIIVLDASAGVEAQTITVWGQTERHELPRIIFVNKMDRPDANFTSCIEDLKGKLGAQPLAIHFPIHENGQFKGIIDIVQQKQLRFDVKNLGKSYEVAEIENTYKEEMFEAKKELVDILSGCDDELAEMVIEQESLEKVDLEQIMHAIRRNCISRRIVPVLLGSAYKNTGVQPLLDGILNFLPAPFERNRLYDCFEDDFVGKVFKVVHDKQRGPLSLVRVHRGVLKKGSKVVTTRGGSEQITRIYAPLADEYKDVNEVDEGNIGVCSGLKNTLTGDLLVSSTVSLKKAQKRLLKTLSKSPIVIHENDDDDDLAESANAAFALEPKIPDAVYFCSIEPPSQAYQQALDTALRQLQREDPSLRVKYDETTGQTVLGGMGELHLDIVKSRILTEYKIEADLGPLQIAYKESIGSTCRDSVKIEKDIAGTKQSVHIELSLVNKRDTKFTEDFRLDTSPECAEQLAGVRPKLVNLVRKGALASLGRGPKLGAPVVEVQVVLHFIQIGRGTAESFVMASAGQCVHKILQQQTDAYLLEPIMQLQIVVPTEKVGTVLADLSRRRAKVSDVSPKGDQNRIIDALAPLAELSGYSSTVRTITSGTASITMSPHSHAQLGPQDETVAIQRAQGLL